MEQRTVWEVTHGHRDLAYVPVIREEHIRGVWRGIPVLMVLEATQVNHRDLLVHFADLENTLFSQDCYLFTGHVPSSNTPTLVAVFEENEEEALEEVAGWLHDHEKGHFADPEEDDEECGGRISTYLGDLRNAYFDIKKVKSEDLPRYVIAAGIVKGQLEAIAAAKEGRKI